ncbi:MAG TPA: alanine--tRNA ligase [Deltaproteobacteria bacterium]|mgnify:CR=1 FL=1|nr:alanine--tRNA ligase [Deltaproteobacteria bacterium]
MKGSEIRTMFLQYFQEKGHTIVPSSSLVPADDPSLLFTNAGMVQFKSVFLGTDKRPYSRATTSQKCVRAGGKHNDLENVGRTARHHTFFEMLGNFSFGDYFKEGAIEFAWELLVQRMGLDPTKLWVSVHLSDDEAFAIWRDKIGLSPERIIRLGDKDNFWAMGDTGPCGPCSEIIYDQGPSIGCGRPECTVGECDCDRYLEIWNLVFMQYNKDESGVMEPLPNPSIDTGMGLERITAVMQGVKSNYDTDLFVPLIAYIADMAGITYRRNEDNDVSVRVIADHARASAFLVGDGVLPSNEGRGYVLRRIIRRAARHGKLLGLNKPFLHDVAMQVIAQMGDVYPELKSRRDFIDKVIANEEDRFLKTLDRGLTLLDEVMAEVRSKGQTVIPGDAVFMLYDTFGFPVDLTQDIAEKQGFTLDAAGFEAQMELQREKARTASSFSGVMGEGIAMGATIKKEEVRFVGYDTFETHGTVLELHVKTDHGGYAPADELAAGQEGCLIASETPFYGESGGQVGDTGRIFAPNFSADVLDTTKTDSGIMIHAIVVTEGAVVRGQVVTLSVDASRRKSIMRHHSATHLLQRALRDVLGEHVHQSGSLVSEARLRFDFTHFAPVKEDEIARIEAIVNQYVLEDLPIRVEITSKEAALSKGAMALFDEKYGDEVRMVVMGDDVSVELCGGTHCRATGQIGLVKVVSEGSVSAGLRRIEAIAGTRSLEHLQSLTSILDDAAKALRCTPSEIRERIAAQQARIKEQEAAIKDLQLKLVSGAASAKDEEQFESDGYTVVIRKVDLEDVGQLREMGDRIKQQIGTGVVFLASPAKNRATFMIMVTKDLEGRVDAGDLMKTIAAAVNGRGGGKGLFAQGGAPDGGTIEKAIEIFRHEIAGGV